jgi:uncharacterized protein YggE
MNTITQGCTLMLGVMLILHGSLAADADEKELGRMIVVTGSGQAKATPDMATLRAGVVTQAGTAAAALAENGKQMQQVFAGLADFGIPAADQQTSNFTVTPQYSNRRATTPEAPQIVGYEVRNQVMVTVRDVNRVGELVDALVRLGANQLQEVQFTLGDPETLLDQARVAAVKDAQHKADLLSRAAGATLGQVLGIEELSSNKPQPVFMARASVAESVPIAPGQELITVTVSVRFRLQ